MRWPLNLTRQARDDEWRWSSQAPEKTVSLAKNDEELRSGVKIEDRKKADVERYPSSGVPDQDASQDDEGGDPQRGTTSSYANVVVYGGEGDRIGLRHVQVGSPPSSVEDLVSLPVMSKKALRRSLTKGDISQLCAIVEAIDKDSVNTASCADAQVWSYPPSFKQWSEFLPLCMFALHNSTHVSTGRSPLYVNYASPSESTSVTSG